MQDVLRVPTKNPPTKAAETPPARRGGIVVRAQPDPLDRAQQALIEAQALLDTVGAALRVARAQQEAMSVTRGT